MLVFINDGSWRFLSIFYRFGLVIFVLFGFIDCCFVVIVFFDYLKIGIGVG